MKKRYLPFGYQITDGKTTIAQEEAEAVQYIFEEYTAGKSLRTPYHEDTQKWNQNMVSRILANEIYCGNEKYFRCRTKKRPEPDRFTINFYRCIAVFMSFWWLYAFFFRGEISQQLS